jgi:hypothetical protein
MKKWIWVLAIFVILVGISSDQGSTESSKNSKKDSPRLVLSASPRQGLSPHHVAINARLENVSDHDQDWYCLKEEWDFGDGTVSAEDPQCDPYTPDTKITKEFFADHTYEDEGNYTIRFKVGKDKLRSNQVTVVVLEGNMDNGSGSI